MTMEWEWLTNKYFIVLLVVSIIFWLVGFTGGNYPFINYGTGVFIAMVIFYLLKRHNTKK